MLSILASVFLASAIVAIVIQLAAAPRPGPPIGGAPTVYPANPFRLVTNNLKTPDTLRLDLLTPQGTAAWILASSNSGPSYIGPYFTNLGPDWFILAGPLIPAVSNHVLFDVPIPVLPGIVGLEFVIQCGVVSTVSSDVGFSNSQTLRASQGGPGQNVLILRQTAQIAGIPNAPQQADALAAALGAFGHHVTVVSDLLPQSLLDYDCILDLRFTALPAPDEAARFVQFLKSCGGVLFVSGPYAANMAGQLRAGWLGGFLNGELGIGVTISAGGNVSATTVETIPWSIDPYFLNVPLSIAGLPFDVSDEGGTFGPPGTNAAGMPWLVGSTNVGTFVFGMFFEPSTMALTVGGRVGVLFAGGANTFLPTSTSPYPEFVMSNVVNYLDR